MLLKIGFAQENYCIAFFLAFLFIIYLYILITTVFVQIFYNPAEFAIPTRITMKQRQKLKRIQWQQKLNIVTVQCCLKPYKLLCGFYSLNLLVLFVLIGNVLLNITKSRIIFSSIMFVFYVLVYHLKNILEQSD